MPTLGNFFSALSGINSSNGGHVEGSTFFSTSGFGSGTSVNVENGTSNNSTAGLPGVAGASGGPTGAGEPIITDDKVPQFTALLPKQLASIRVYSATGEGSQQLLPKYTRFYTTAVQESHQEKAQIIETFGSFNVYFYGSRPSIWTFSGVFRNDVASNWANQMELLYDTVLRGTMLAEKRAKVVLSYDNVIIEGYFMGKNTTKIAGQNASATFSFSILITNIRPLGPFDDQFIKSLQTASPNSETESLQAETFSSSQIWRNASSTRGEVFALAPRAVAHYTIGDDPVYP